MSDVAALNAAERIELERLRERLPVLERQLAEQRRLVNGLEAALEVRRRIDGHRLEALAALDQFRAALAPEGA